MGTHGLAAELTI